MTGTDRLDDAYRTRPGTPMVGEYSVHQMDDFYAALACGQVKPTGIMNLLQRLIIAERCHDGDRLVDVCCGRGLQLPVLNRYRPGLGSYTGLDISEDNLAEARHRAAGEPDAGGEAEPSPFPVTFCTADVAEAWPVAGPFDVAVYTSALEHLPREQGIASLRHTTAMLAPRGQVFLSTPNTPGDPPRRLQHRVHVYEWSHAELVEELERAGLVVDEVIGILAPDEEQVTDAVRARFGDGGAALYEQMAGCAPAALLGSVIATAIEDAASEVLYVCSGAAA